MEKMKLRFFGGLTFRSQQRMGFPRVFFPGFKFCFMEVGAESKGVTRSTHNLEPRPARMSGFLRRINLDELVQRLKNLKGDMSPSGRRIIFA